jgi:hypothetical protein
MELAQHGGGIAGFVRKRPIEAGEAGQGGFRGEDGLILDALQVVAGHGPGPFEEAPIRGVRKHLLLEAWRSAHG